ncbi:MAG: hypothetical protein OES32_02530 [Acidobacteriota bacterium]|nr:hypothetical protein [Acidobacteriota bacterium]MDH3522438.1 hypothetical protein [Acidobacteriota bacterium]
MNCTEAQTALVSGCVPSGSENPWGAFEAHLEVCADCGRKLRETEPIRELVRDCCARLGAPWSLRLRIVGALPHRAA